MKKIKLLFVASIFGASQLIAQVSTDGSGNVGIGTTSPTGAFHMARDGYSYFTGNSDNQTMSNIQGLVIGWNKTAGNGETCLAYSTFPGSAPRLAFGSHDGNTYNEEMSLKNGNLGIGIKDPDVKLAVKGDIKAWKLTVLPSTTWPDYVFSPEYKLPNLQEIEAFIQQHKHLPEIPTEEEVKKNGLDVGNNQSLLLKKIEELTIFLIDQSKQLEKLRQENLLIQAKLAALASQK